MRYKRIVLYKSLTFRLLDCTILSSLALEVCTACCCRGGGYVSCSMWSSAGSWWFDWSSICTLSLSVLMACITCLAKAACTSLLWLWGVGWGVCLADDSPEGGCELLCSYISFNLSVPAVKIRIDEIFVKTYKHSIAKEFYYMLKFLILTLQINFIKHCIILK